jgi:hypothetical protein
MQAPVISITYPILLTLLKLGPNGVQLLQMRCVFGSQLLHMLLLNASQYFLQLLSLLTQQLLVPASRWCHMADQPAEVP